MDADMVTSSQVVEMILVPLLGLHLAHFLIQYAFRTGKIKLERTEDNFREISVVYQELVLRTALYFCMITVVLWCVVGPTSLLIALLGATGTFCTDYWCRVNRPRLSEEHRVFWAKTGLNQLFFNFLFPTLVCLAYVLNRHGITP